MASRHELRNNSVVKTPVNSLAPSEDLRTRDQVARAILESGPSTAVALAEKLQLTPAFKPSKSDVKSLGLTWELRLILDGLNAGVS